MNNRLGSAPGWAGQVSLESEGLTPTKELRHFKNVISSVLQDGLDVWAGLWGEFEDKVTAGVLVLPEAEKGFKPQCGWPEFLEKMWQLRFYLASAKKFCDERP